MNKLYFFILSIFFLILLGCTGNEIIERNYYVMNYNPSFEKDSLIKEKPYNLSVIIKDSELPRTYKRKQIVTKQSVYRISYSDNNLWAVEIDEAIPNIIATRIKNYNIFEQIFRGEIKEKIRYEIRSKIENLDFILFDTERAAHLQMTITLYDNEQQKSIFVHRVDQQKLLYKDDYELFVQGISDILNQETDNFVQKIFYYLDTGKSPELKEKELIVYKNNEFTFVEQLNDYDLLGKGRLEMPTLTTSDQEPAFIVKDEEGNIITNSQMGMDVLLEQGTYQIIYGSGHSYQRLSKQIEIKPRYKTLVEPDWGCLTISLIDENRASVDDRYEIYKVNTYESFGTGVGVDEELGEKPETWILEPGDYKIILNGYSFNTYIDFTTVTLHPGELKELTIVVNSETGTMVGAGDISNSENLKSSLLGKFSSAVHANASITSDNKTDKEDPISRMNFTAQLDNRYIYNEGAYYFSLKNLIDIGTSKETGTDFRISADDFSLKTSFVYYFSKMIGLYLRFDTDTHFIEVNKYYENPSNAKKRDINGNDKEFTQVDKISVSPSFFPLNLKEGLGLNLRILNTPRAKLDLRTGFGMRQDIYKDVFTFEKTETDSVTNILYDIYQENDSSYQEGLEVSLMADFQLPINLSYNSDLDILFPFDKQKNTSFVFGNIFNLKILDPLSIDYKVTLTKNDEIQDYLIIDHNLFLRFTYYWY